MSYLGVSAARQGITQAVAFTGTSATSANGFGSGTTIVSLSANAACHYKVVEAAGAAATTSDSFLPANWVREIVVTPGQKISAIRAVTDGIITATSGTLFVTEMSG